MARVLVVDDERSLVEILSALLITQKHEVATARNGDDALALLDESPFELMISDIRMNPMNGVELLKHALEKQPFLAVVLVTAYASVETAMEALKFGAFDYVTKPFQVPELVATINRALEYGREKRHMAMDARPDVTPHMNKIIAENPAMKQACETVKRVGPTDMPVLICGERGTGRELIARAIHEHSPRAAKPFVVVDCVSLTAAALETALFGTPDQGNAGHLLQEAWGGALLFNGIDALPVALQDTLVTRLFPRKKKGLDGIVDETPPDVRVLASTCKDLSEEATRGNFSPDLLARLSVASLHLPPLRERREDILPIAFTILEQASDDEEPWVIDWETRLVFETYPWPGNVRELENTIRHALAFADENRITRDGLPPKIAQTPVSEEAEAAAKRLADMRGQALKGFLEKQKNALIKQGRGRRTS